jgi:hypothetical protein
MSDMFERDNAGFTEDYDSNAERVRPPMSAELGRAGRRRQRSLIRPTRK